MKVKRKSNGNLVVPVRHDLPGGAVGDGVEEIGPGHRDYQRWVRWLKVNPEAEQNDEATDETAPRS